MALSRTGLGDLLNGQGADAPASFRRLGIAAASRPHNGDPLYPLGAACSRDHRVAVFVDGDFWHGRDWERRKERLAQARNAD